VALARRMAISLPPSALSALKAIASDLKKRKAKFAMTWANEEGDGCSVVYDDKFAAAYAECLRTGKLRKAQLVKRKGTSGLLTPAPCPLSARLNEGSTPILDALSLCRRCVRIGGDCRHRS
jgi:hypothetical protein